MIKIPSKSFAANSWKVYPYQMDDEMQVFSGQFPAEVFDKIKTLTDPVGNGKPRPLQSLIINCHGAPALLELGIDGLSWHNLDHWKHLRFPGGKPRVKTIYLVSCNIISFEGKGDGNLFCGAIAKWASAYVIASNQTQKPSLCPKGQIDKFEGKVWEYHPDGSNRAWDGIPTVR